MTLSLSLSHTISSHTRIYSYIYIYIYTSTSIYFFIRALASFFPMWLLLCAYPVRCLPPNVVSFACHRMARLQANFLSLTHSLSLIHSLTHSLSLSWLSASSRHPTFSLASHAIQSAKSNLNSFLNDRWRPQLL